VNIASSSSLTLFTIFGNNFFSAQYAHALAKKSRTNSRVKNLCFAFSPLGTRARNGQKQSAKHRGKCQKKKWKKVKVLSHLRHALMLAMKGTSSSSSTCRCMLDLAQLQRLLLALLRELLYAPLPTSGPEPLPTRDELLVGIVLRLLRCSWHWLASACPALACLPPLHLPHQTRVCWIWIQLLQGSRLLRRCELSHTKESESEG
jgi:hypothetical protein